MENCIEENNVILRIVIVLKALKISICSFDKTWFDIDKYYLIKLNIFSFSLYNNIEKCYLVRYPGAT